MYQTPARRRSARRYYFSHLWPRSLAYTENCTGEDTFFIDIIELSLHQIQNIWNMTSYYMLSVLHKLQLVYSISDKQVAIQYSTAQRTAASGWFQPEAV